MTSTKVMLLGILIMLAGLAVDSTSTRVVTVSPIGIEGTTNLVYSAVALFVVGFVAGLIGFFRR